VTITAWKQRYMFKVRCVKVFLSEKLIFGNVQCYCHQARKEEREGHLEHKGSFELYHSVEEKPACFKIYLSKFTENMISIGFLWPDALRNGTLYEVKIWPLTHSIHDTTYSKLPSINSAESFYYCIMPGNAQE